VNGDGGSAHAMTARVHRALAAAALLLGLLAAFAGEPADSRSARVQGGPAGSGADTVAPDSAAPRRRLDGRRGCAW